MVLPIELNVVKGGVYPDPKEVDFGILTTPDHVRRVAISLLNSAPTPIAILDVAPSLPDSLMRIEFEKGLVIPAGVEEPAALVLGYSGKTPGRVSGKVRPGLERDLSPRDHHSTAGTHSSAGAGCQMGYS
jgi:hypothetical protein